MTDHEGVTDVFDDDVVAGVATDHDLAVERLHTLLASHQAGVAELPGVENLVYEWRRQFDATVLDSTADAYYVAAPPWVWEEFAASLDASETEASALAAVHAREVQARVDGATADGDHALVVLDRSA